MTAADTPLSAKKGGLRIQQCDDCKLYLNPPTSVCYRCDSRALGLRPVSGHGTLYSWTRVYRPSPARLGAAPSYLVAQVELAEQPGLYAFANLPTVRDEFELSTGMPVVALEPANENEPVDFEPVRDRGDA